MSEKMIVHVGMHKTGTTAIQNSLAANLKDERYKYVSFQRPNGSLAIRQAFLPMGFGSNNDQCEHQIAKTKRNSIDQIESALVELKDETAIISAEVIYILPKDALQSCFNFLRNYRKDLQVTAYLRNINSYIDSAFQEELKTRLETFDRPHINAQYKTRLQIFEDIVGTENMIIRHFSRENLHKNCVVQDFCHSLNINFSSNDVINANERLSADATRLLYIYRTFFPTRQAGDDLLIETLTNLNGQSFRLSKGLRGKVNLTAPEEVEWASELLNVDLHNEDDQSNGPVIETEADMFSISPASMEWLASKTKAALANLKLPRDLADTMNALRINLLNQDRDNSQLKKSKGTFGLLNKWMK